MIDGQNMAEGDRPFSVEIRVRGRIDEHWSDWFEGLTITYTEVGPGGPGSETLLSGSVADQAALYGLLANLGALGLSLLSVNRIEDAATEKEGKNARDDLGSKEPGQEIR